MTKQEECLNHDWHYSESREFRICWECLRKEYRDWRLFEIDFNGEKLDA